MIISKFSSSSKFVQLDPEIGWGEVSSTALQVLESILRNETSSE